MYACIFGAPSALLRVGVPAIRAELTSRTEDQAQQPSRELSSAGATARAQSAPIQVASLRAALPEYACDPRCENSEPMLPRNGKALSQPHDAWPVLALDAYLLRCRDKAGLLIGAVVEACVRSAAPEADQGAARDRRLAVVETLVRLWNSGSSGANSSAALTSMQPRRRSSSTDARCSRRKMSESRPTARSIMSIATPSAMRPAFV